MSDSSTEGKGVDDGARHETFEKKEVYSEEVDDEGKTIIVPPLASMET